MKLNLPCGSRKLKGYWNVDISPDCSPDEVRDALIFPWPWTEVEEIYCSHFIEHLGDEFIPFMDECWRVLQPSGVLHIQCPYYTSIRAWQDPTHKRAISEWTFNYFSKKWLAENGIAHYPIKADFEIGDINYYMLDRMKDLPEAEVEFQRLHYWNTVADIEVRLIKQ